MNPIYTAANSAPANAYDEFEARKRKRAKNKRELRQFRAGREVWEREKEREEGEKKKGGEKIN